MTILLTDLKYYKSMVVSTDGTNGGSISNNEAVSGVPNNIWPNVLKADRDSGLITYRKIFLKAVTDNNDIFYGSDLWNEAPTAAGDWIELLPGTADDTQATLNDFGGYCASSLSSAAGIGASTLIVELEDSSLATCFPVGRDIRVTNKSNPSSGTGTEERHVVSSTTLSSTTLTIVISGTLTSAYAIGDKVEGVLDYGDVKSEVTNLNVTSSGGSFDDASFPPIGNNSGAVTESITMTATDSTHFTVVGTKSGVLSTWDTGNGDYTPIHPVSGNVMFILDVLALGGTYVSGDTITFDVTGCYVPFWLKRTVPAGSDSLANNLNTTYTYGQS